MRGDARRKINFLFLFFRGHEQLLKMNKNEIFHNPDISIMEKSRIINEFVKIFIECHLYKCVTITVI